MYVGSAAEAGLGDALASAAHAPVTNLAGRTSLEQASALFRDSAVTIAVDSGPMHLAAAAGARLVALFGPGDPVQSGPWSNDAVVLGGEAPCGCQHARCDSAGGPGRCMRAIGPDVVLDAVRTVMARAPLERS